MSLFFIYGSALVFAIVLAVVACKTDKKTV